MYIDLTVGYALILSFLAGIATTIGALLALFVRKPSEKFTWFSLSFSAGVMLQISFVELLRSSIDFVGFSLANLYFIAGLSFLYLIDISIPHEYIAEKISSKNPKLMKIGLLTAIGISIHNFPEGFATFTGAMHSLNLGILLAVAIAIHNIPEGFSIFMPIFSATRNRRLAFLYSFSAGISEFIGALLGGLFLLPFLSVTLLNSMLAFIAGIMVYISLDELLPSAYGDPKGHLPALGIILGILVMTISLVILK